MRRLLRWSGWVLLGIATAISLAVLGAVGSILIVYLISLLEP